MRPQILFGLFAPVTSLAGVGPRLGALFGNLGLKRVLDLVWHLPVGIIDRRQTPKIAETQSDQIATLVVRVDRHEPPRTRRLPYRVRCHDDTGFLTLVFFNGQADYLLKVLPEGETRVASGRIERFRDEIQMAHPDHVVPLEARDQIAIVEPVYGLTTGVTPRVMAKAVKGALSQLPDLPEWIETSLTKRELFPSWRAAVAAAHAPGDLAAIAPTTPERRRLAYDEFLANQLALGLVRAKTRHLPGRALKGDGALRARVIAALPYTLTTGQTAAIADVERDLRGPHRMLRLLQGDVGSGKTVVALLAMLAAIEAGTQAALMAPTDLLARQHFATISGLAAAADIEVALLTGRENPKAKAAILAGLANGTIKLVVGTHALVQDDVEFKALGLVVIDEQHRFGVEQRLALADKGQAHVLVMTATPIPRTLMLVSYGDMEVSLLKEKPAGRKPITTRVLPLERMDEVIERLTKRLDSGDRVYWVCPLVAESEKIDLAAAEDRHRDLTARLGDGRVALVHGRLKGPARDAAMERFQRGEAQILVATTVIEVGVDVPEANVMVIEHAERFGLAQLHQLRGRIGRGAAASTCLLLYGQPLSETAKARLSVLRESEDGFRIAEEDLRLRGAGEALGTRQSGFPEFRVANPAVHADLLEIARDDAKLILGNDPDLAGPRGNALRVLLYLFERDAAVRLLRSG